MRALEGLQVHARTGCVVLGYRRKATGPFAYHPQPTTRLRVGGALMALGEPSQIAALRALVSREGPIEQPAPSPSPASQLGDEV